MKTKVAMGILLAATLGFVGYVSLERLERSGRGPVRPVAESLPVLWNAPEFSLPRAGGGTLSRADLLGRIWVVDFFFTRCAGQCMTLTKEMRLLQDEAPDLTLVSFSVDPEHDTAEVLAARAAETGADLKRWYFLTGERDVLRALSFEGFKLTVKENPGDVREPIAHDPRLQLVDRRGRVRGQYSVNEPEKMEQLRADLATLRQEVP